MPLCTSDTELMSVSLRPFYLPREFPQLFVMHVYIHLKAKVDMATWAVVRTVQRQDSRDCAGCAELCVIFTSMWLVPHDLLNAGPLL